MRAAAGAVRDTLPLRAWALVGALVAALLVSLPLLPSLDAADPWGTWAVMSIGAGAAGFVAVETADDTLLNGASVFIVAAALLLPPELMLLTVLAHGAGQVTVRHAWYRTAFNLASFAAGGVVAWAAASAVGGTPIAGDLRFLLAGIAAATAYVGFNQLHAALVIRASTPGLQRPPAGNALPHLVLAVGTASVGIGVAGLWQTNPWLLVTLATPVFFAFRAFQVPMLRDAIRVEPKTGLFNAAHFQDSLVRELARARRFGRPASVLMADLDFLREINTSHGHLAADGVIVGIARILRSELRSVDIAARFGGEEYSVLLPETAKAEAEQVAERIRGAAAAAEFPQGIRATLSIGVAAFPDDGETAAEVLEAADRALYAAKAYGRNRIASAPAAAPVTA